MTESFTKTDNKQKSVVLLEYPRKGVWAVGFATKENEGLIKDKIKEEVMEILEEEKVKHGTEAKEFHVS